MIITSSQPLTDCVALVNALLHWTAKTKQASGETRDTWELGSSGPHEVFVTYGLPNTHAGSDSNPENGLTVKRIRACVGVAQGFTSAFDIAPKIQAWLGGPANSLVELASFLQPKSDDWDLLDFPNESGVYPVVGECGEWAFLMHRAMNLLGVIQGDRTIVNAADPGMGANCLDRDRRNANSERLILTEDLPTWLPPLGENIGQNCYRLGGINGVYYSVRPVLTGVTSKDAEGNVINRGDLKILNQLTHKRQDWVKVLQLAGTGDPPAPEDVINTTIFGLVESNIPKPALLPEP